MENTKDVIVIGAGLGGIATAIGAAVRGHNVTIIEKDPEKVGGAAAFSGGQVWIAGNHVETAEGIEDSVAEGERYVRAGAKERPDLLDEESMQRWLQTAPVAAKYFEDLGAVKWRIIPGYPDYGYPDQPGSRDRGRYLTAVFDPDELGEWREHLRVTPHFPCGFTYDELLGAGKRMYDDVEDPDGDSAPDSPDDSGASTLTAFGTNEQASPDRRLYTFGTGVTAGFLARMAQEEVTVLMGHTATELLRDGSGVTGVRISDPDGATRDLHGTVVIATGSFDWDPEQSKDYLGIEGADYGSMAPRVITGDGLRLANQAGAALFRIPGQYVPNPPGYEIPTEPGFAASTEHSLPHSFIVDRSGRRFCDDSLYWDVTRRALDPDDPHLPCYMIWDEQHHQKYALGAMPAGSEYPEDLITSRPTLRELGDALGIDNDELERTAERFNKGAEIGEDPDFHRGALKHWSMYVGDVTRQPNPCLGPVAQPPFHAMRLRILSTGIGLSGIKIDPDGRVLDRDEAAIPGLYAVGSCAAFRTSGSGYNSGYSLSRAITLAYLVVAQLSDAPAERSPQPSGGSFIACPVPRIKPRLAWLRTISSW